MTDVILLFPSNSGTMIATRMLRDSGVTARVIPTPPSAQSSSNLCLSIERTTEIDALEVLRAARVSPTAIVR
jgi:hypothetical protein